MKPDDPKLLHVEHQIEELRKRMFWIIETRGIRDPRVLNTSHELDSTITEYFSLLKECSQQMGKT